MNKVFYKYQIQAWEFMNTAYYETCTHIVTHFIDSKMWRDLGSKIFNGYQDRYIFRI